MTIRQVTGVWCRLVITVVGTTVSDPHLPLGESTITLVTLEGVWLVVKHFMASQSLGGGKGFIAGGVRAGEGALLLVGVLVAGEMILAKKSLAAGWKLAAMGTFTGVSSHVAIEMTDSGKGSRTR